jgi:outer membrane protein OmpA-like peptidoglycan-associated protein
MQHFAGLTFKFGGKDTDGDGIYDKDDACPEVAGLLEFNGCPDTDGDKIIDSEDECPDLAGPASLKGCPDTDGDGLADKNDDCPEVAGPASLRGCPDTDGDGIADKDDKCPNEKGPRENGGCPWPDRDGDTVLDKDDRCPDVAGTVANQGCPEITEAKVQAINDAAKNIFFETGTSKLKKESMVTLDGMSFIMLEHPEAKFKIEGHTDSTGSKALNKKLSQSRADAVKDYLASKGVNVANLTSTGFGPDNPISENKTAVGRAKNRRVDVILVK